MKVCACRLLPDTDLKQELQRIAKEKNLQAGSILTCVGSLSKATLRMAGAQAGKEDVKTYEEELEIVSAEGTLSVRGMHIHLGLSKTNGECIGGHLKDGCIIKTTTEVVVGEAPDLQFLREADEKTGFDELVVKPSY